MIVGLRVEVTSLRAGRRLGRWRSLTWTPAATRAAPPRRRAPRRPGPWAAAANLAVTVVTSPTQLSRGAGPGPSSRWVGTQQIPPAPPSRGGPDSDPPDGEVLYQVDSGGPYHHGVGLPARSPRNSIRRPARAHQLTPSARRCLIRTGPWPPELVAKQRRWVLLCPALPGMLDAVPLSL